MTITIRTADGTIDSTPPDMDIGDAYADMHTCDSCGADVPLTASGRQFQKCIDCRREARGGVNRGRTATATSNGAKWQVTLASQLNDILTGIGQAVEAVVNPFDGQIIQKGSPKFCSSLMVPAEQNPKIRKTLTMVAEGGAWGAVVAAGLAIVLPILANHQLLPMQIKQRQEQQRQASRPQPDPTMVGHVNV
jgi:hypothetical protein